MFVTVILSCCQLLLSFLLIIIILVVVFVVVIYSNGLDLRVILKNSTDIFPGSGEEGS